MYNLCSNCSSGVMLGMCAIKASAAFIASLAINFPVHCALITIPLQDMVLIAADSITHCSWPIMSVQYQSQYRPYPHFLVIPMNECSVSKQIQAISPLLGDSYE